MDGFFFVLGYSGGFCDINSNCCGVIMCSYIKRVNVSLVNCRRGLVVFFVKCFVKLIMFFIYFYYNMFILFYLLYLFCKFMRFY